jgi:hypothetical protein
MTVDPTTEEDYDLDVLQVMIDITFMLVGFGKNDCPNYEDNLLLIISRCSKYIANNCCMKN